MHMTFRDLKTDQKHELTVRVLEVEITYPDGSPCAGKAYELRLEPGGTRKGTLDANGRLVEKDVPQGAKGELSVEGAPVIALAE